MSQDAGKTGGGLGSSKVSAPQPIVIAQSRRVSDTESGRWLTDALSHMTHLDLVLKRMIQPITLESVPVRSLNSNWVY
jgi:hypothetical protein